MMKKLTLSIVFLVAVLTVWACSSSDNADEPTPGGGNTTPVETTLELTDSKSATHQLTFDVSENWRVRLDADWITAVPMQGTAGTGKKTTLTINENTDKELRSAVVKVVTVKDANPIVILTVKQPAREVTLTDDENPAAPAGMKKNASGMVKAIKVGWNLGNTCEASPWEGWSGDELEIETLWGNPYTTREMVTALKNAGFNALRIPTRWGVHADADLNISSVWMNRIKEIVDYAVSQDMYVIVNTHHDNWFDNLPVGADKEAIYKKYTRMWTQIAEAFKDYDEHLLLEGANEVIKLKADGTQDWGTPTADDIAYTNRLMQLFVDAVRATGGNNQWRCLLVLPWASNPNNALADAFSMPDDDTPHRLIVEYHCYDPYHYAIGKDVPDNQYAVHEFTDADKQPIADLFGRLNRKFVEAGIPCLMGEFGSTQDNSYNGGKARADEIRAAYHKFVVSEARKYNIPGFYWDNNAFDGKGENFGLLDRNTCTFSSRAKVALNGIMEGVK